MKNQRLLPALLVLHWLFFMAPFFYGWMMPVADESPKSWIETLPSNIVLILAGVFVIGGILLLINLACGKRLAVYGLAIYHCFFTVFLSAMAPFVASTPNILLASQCVAYFLLGVAFTLVQWDHLSVSTDSSPQRNA